MLKLKFFEMFWDGVDLPGILVEFTTPPVVIGMESQF